MPKNSKDRGLKGALDRYKGRNIDLEKQRKSEKDASKRKEHKIEQELDDEVLDEARGVALDAAEAEAAEEEFDGELKDDEDLGESESDGEDDDLDEGEANDLDIARLNDSEGDSDEGEDADEEVVPKPIRAPTTNGISTKPSLADQLATIATSKDTSAANQQEDQEDSDAASSIALSDISARSDAEDIVPHQRLTINNTSALNKALKSISLPYAELSFSEHQSITSPESAKIDDVNDDLTRELAFYAQSLAAVNTARDLLKKEGAPFTRPSDYFAEMVKSDEHMSKIKSKLTEDAAAKKASAEAKRQRDLKKFGKKVQEEKLKERAKEKRDMLEKVKVLKRKRGGNSGGAGGEAEGEGLFDVALEDAADTEGREKRERREKKAGVRREQRPGQGRSDGAPNAKRQKKDGKFGFGGKKRGSKRPDAQSSGDMSGFSTKRMKGQTSAKGAKKGPGKDRRSKMR